MQFGTTKETHNSPLFQKARVMFCSEEFGSSVFFSFSVDVALKLVTFSGADTRIRKSNEIFLNFRPPKAARQQSAHRLDSVHAKPSAIVPFGRKSPPRLPKIIEFRSVESALGHSD
jgi:hypothetical protein